MFHVSRGQSPLMQQKKGVILLEPLRYFNDGFIFLEHFVLQKICFTIIRIILGVCMVLTKHIPSD